VELVKNQKKSTSNIDARSAAAANGRPRAGAMNCISLNCRGCGRPKAVQEIRNLVDEVKPAVVFPMETRMNRERSLELRGKLGFPNDEAVSAEGLSGGPTLLWRGDVTVAIQSMSKSHIDVVLSCPNVGMQQWRLTGFYGDPRRELRRNSWYLLCFLRAQLDVPWLCLGDFNEVLDSSEHFGATVRDRW
jgi:hypothetical protein